MGSPLLVESRNTMMQEPSTGRSRTTSLMMSPEHDDCNEQSLRDPQLPTGRTAAMKLNHEAVILLMSGSEQEKAMELLKQSLSHVKSDLVSAPPSSSSSPQNDEHGRDGIEVTAQRNRTNVVMPPRPQRGNGDRLVRIVSVPVYPTRGGPLNEGDGFYLYTNAFTCDLSNVDETKCSPLSSMIDGEMLSAIIIYNLALSLTIKAIRTNSFSLRTRSMRLYEMCIGLLNNIIMFRTGHIKEGNLPCDFAWNVAVACSNNLGQLAFLQGDYERSQSMRSALQYLLSSPLLVRHESGVGSSRISFSDTDLRGFKMNIMFMYAPISAPMA